MNSNYKQFKYLITYCILALITILVYLPSLYYPFQFDDLPNILNYAQLKLSTFKSLFFAHSRWICTYLNCYLYQHFDSNPIVCRLINLIIHIANGALVFNLCLKFKHKLIKDNFSLAIITTSLFLLHPVQTQTISYVIQGQLEGLASMFMLLAITSFIYYAKSHNNFKKNLNLFSLFIFLILATSTKEIAIITPVLILLLDWFWLSPKQLNLAKIKARILIYLSLFSTTIIIYLYYLKPAFFLKLLTGKQVVQFNTGNMLSAAGTNSVNQFQFLISQFKVICHYLQIFIWPLNICVEYDWQICTSFWDLSCCLPFGLIIILFYLIYKLLKQDFQHPCAFGLIWFLICILPRSSLIASGELLVDYKTYLASFGIFFTLAYLIVLIINTQKQLFKKKLILFLFYTSFIYTLTILTYHRNLVWRSTTNFWQDVICKAPNKARGFNNYGMALLENGENAKAMFYFKRALELNKTTNLENFYWDPYQNLANAYALNNQIDLAINIIKQALIINPKIAELQNNLGALLLHQNDYQTSIRHLELALLFKPNNGQTLYNLGKAYLALNQPEQAWNYLDQACRNTHMDRLENVLQLYIETCVQLRKLDCAIWGLQKMIKNNPKNIGALFNLGGAYYFKHDYLSAQDCYLKILELDSNNQAAKSKLAILNKLI